MATCSAGEDRAELERAASRRSFHSQVTNNLPAQISSFVGRERDAARVKDFVASQRFVSLVGTGGVGKTRLALHVAAEFLTSLRDGVWFVDLASISDASQVPAAIASGLELERITHLDRSSVT